MKKNKGITLIALVITIIILLILAGITISSLTQSGLFNRAKEAAKVSKYSSDMEMIRMAKSVSDLEELTDSYPEGRDIFLEELRKTDTNADVDYDEWPVVTVYYNKDYYQIDWEIDEIKEYEYVAQIGDTKYVTIQAAVDAVKANNNNETIILLKDTKENIVIAENKNITLDMKNFSIETYMENYGKFKIVNGTLVGPPESNILSNEGDFEVDGCNFNYLSGMYNLGSMKIVNSVMYASSYYTTIWNEEGSTCIVENSELSSVSYINMGTLVLDMVEYDERTSFTNDLISNYGNVTIQNDSYIYTDNYNGGIIENCENGEINIVDSMIECKIEVIDNQEGGKVKISDSYLKTSYRWVINNSGTLEVTGGRIETTGEASMSNAIVNYDGIATVTSNVVCIPKNQNVTVVD